MLNTYYVPGLELRAGVTRAVELVRELVDRQRTERAPGMDRSFQKEVIMPNLKK